MAGVLWIRRSGARCKDMTRFFTSMRLSGSVLSSGLMRVLGREKNYGTTTFPFGPI